MQLSDKLRMLNCGRTKFKMRILSLSYFEMIY